MRVYEALGHYGGLCSAFDVDDFRFDRFVHLSFTKNEKVKAIFQNSAQEVHNHPSHAFNYYHGKWLAHPAQNNLYPLSDDEKAEILASYQDREPLPEPCMDYGTWIRSQFGEVFADRFVAAYTRTYWTVEPSVLDTTWVGSRVMTSAYEEMERGAYTPGPYFKFYADGMRYPKKGGYQAFIDGWAPKEDILYHKMLQAVDPVQKTLFFADGTQNHYTHLLSTLPLPDLVPMIKGVPDGFWRLLSS